MASSKGFLSGFKNFRARSLSLCQDRIYFLAYRVLYASYPRVELAMDARIAPEGRGFKGISERKRHPTNPKKHYAFGAGH
jgi:hypothetical protein